MGGGISKMAKQELVATIRNRYQQASKKDCKRTVWGGRAKVRTALYMGALVVSRFNPVIRDFYQRMLSAGKPKKLALTACMRKLLIIRNSMLKYDSSWNHPATKSLTHSY